ncbi:MAG: ribosome biogenesis GTPase Der [Eubacteriales bacterium]|nr:ribosome biogenesis GTPase Der [Eubacteriales bacterium]
MTKKIVSIVGRPNVGKSTLFNAIVGKRVSIVEDTRGVTRDRIYQDANWLDKNFLLVDTGGIENNTNDEMYNKIKEQTNIAIETSNVIIFLVDAKDGLMEEDKNIALMLRKSKKNVILCINKVDNYKKEKDNLYEFYELGFDEIFYVSSINKQGFGDLLDKVISFFEEEIDENENENITKICIIGKPNSGKSSLINKLLDENRSIVSNISGTTRDSIDSYIKKNDKEYLIIDTAGIRRKSIIRDNIEKYSLLRTEMSVQKSDICILMIDATEGITEMDAHIAGISHENSKGIIICINKWDLIEKDNYTIYEYEKKIKKIFSFMPYAEYLFISCKTGQRVNKLFELIDIVRENQLLRISTGTLNEIILQATAMNTLPQDKGKQLKIFYGTQIGVSPPTIVLFVNYKKLMHFSYIRYLENKFRDAFLFKGTPIKIICRERREES